MSVIADILNVAKSRLDQVKIDNGFRVDVEEVVLPQHRVTEYTPCDHTIVVLAGDPVRAETYDRPGNPPAIGYMLPIRVNCIVIPSESSTESQDQITTRLAEDAIRSITRVPDWHQFGGICVNSTVGQPVPFRSDDLSPGGIKFEISAFYRVSETNPSEVRG